MPAYWLNQSLNWVGTINAPTNALQLAGESDFSVLASWFSSSRERPGAYSQARPPAEFSAFFTTHKWPAPLKVVPPNYVEEDIIGSNSPELFFCSYHDAIASIPSGVGAYQIINPCWKNALCVAITTVYFDGSIQHSYGSENRRREYSFGNCNEFLVYLAAELGSITPRELTGQSLATGSLTPKEIRMSNISPPELAKLLENKMASISVVRYVSAGSLVMTIDAKPLHDYLDTIGVPKTATGTYQNRPSTSFAVVNSGGTKLSTDLFLKCEYPVKVNLANSFNNPPTRKQLINLARSSYDAIRAIVEHYYPIDVSITILKSAG